MPVQEEVRRRGVGQQYGEFLKALPHFTGQCRGLHLEGGVVVAVDDFAEADCASEHFGENHRVERQQQPVFLGELVAEYETDGNKLGRLAPALRRHTLDSMKTGLQELFGARTTKFGRFFIRRSLANLAVRWPIWYLKREVHSQPPFSGLEVFGGERRNDALDFRHRFLQSPGRFAPVGFITGTNPFGIFIARTDFAKRTKMAFGCALEGHQRQQG